MLYENLLAISTSIACVSLFLNIEDAVYSINVDNDNNNYSLYKTN